MGLVQRFWAKAPTLPRHPYTGVVSFLNLTDFPVGVGGFEKCRPQGPIPGSRESDLLGGRGPGRAVFFKPHEIRAQPAEAGNLGW